MKKGIWQQDYNSHINTYGTSFMDTKIFSLEIDPHILHNYLLPFSKNFNGNCDIYEFGVYTGGTLRSVINQLKNNNLTFNKAWGFDSFEGLPKEKDGEILEGNHWREGAFSSCDALQIWEWDVLRRKILEFINSDKVELIKGFYKESLKSENLNNFKFLPAMFVNVDVDLYSSTLEVLDWLFSHKIVSQGSIIRYDDISMIPETTGELKAHVEMCNKYSVNYTRLSRDYFLINSIN